MNARRAERRESALRESMERATLAYSALVLVASVASVASVAQGAQLSRLEVEAIEVGPGIKPPSGHGVLVLETPVGAAKSNAHATLPARLLIDKNGWVRIAEFPDGADTLLATAAMKFLKDVRFSPARRGRKRVAVWWIRKVSFRPRIELNAEVPSSGCVPADYELPVDDEASIDDPDLEEPRLLESPEPVYPPALREARIPGKVKFQCVLNTCGRLRDCRVVDTPLDHFWMDKRTTRSSWRYTPAEFAKTGLDALVRRRYTPARRNGVPVTITYITWVHFRP